jgi:hypothetical protein
VFVPTGETPPLPEPLHDIAVPEDLARRIAEHAAATERLREESLRLGEEVRARLRLEPIPDPRSQ